jgi:2-amino-4-hydroxy-6-hydroxymethyldihydropteridine diphosphokinase
MWTRAFVLLPLAEIAPSLVTAAQLQGVERQGIERVSDGPA